MPTHAAFLRAVNLGSTRKTSSADLRSAFEGEGLAEVSTFRTSGNVVFAAGRESAAKLKRRIEKALRVAFGFEVVVFLRTAKEVRAIAAERPFTPKQLESSQGKLQVWLLAEKPAAAAQKKVLELAGGDDRLAFGKRELFWLPKAGTQTSDLDQKAIGKLVGPATMRTMGTIEQVAAKYFGEA